MFQFPGFAPLRLWIQRRVTRLQRAGLPHSETHGSQPACGSPWLIAAYHVLHRLLMPRHPPCALHILSLIILPVPFFRLRPPRIAPCGTQSRYDQRTASATHIAPAVILTLDTLGAPSRLRPRPAAFTARPALPRNGFIFNTDYARTEGSTRLPHLRRSLRATESTIMSKNLFTSGGSPTGHQPGRCDSARGTARHPKGHLAK